MIRPVLLALATPALVLSAAAVARSPDFGASRDLAYVCTVTGTKHLGAAATPEQVCALFKRRIDAAIARQTRVAPVWPSRGNAIRVQVRIASPREVGASATIRAKARIRQVPEITLDVMDKSIQLRDLELLANQLARSIAQS
jgi:hypothetical protein